MNIEGHVALVTGANKGLGREVARQLARKGLAVYVGSRDAARGEEAMAALGRAGASVVAIEIDVTNASSIQRAAARIADEHGHLDVLVNNAGIHVGAPALEITVDDMRKTYETNVFAVVEVTRAMLPLLQRAKAPRIVNVASTTASHTLTCDPASMFSKEDRSLAYASSKAAVTILTVQYANAFRRRPDYAHVKVNAVTPGDRAIAKLLAAEGVGIVVHGRDEGRTNAVAEAIRGDGGRADVALGDLSTDAGADAVAAAAMTGGHVDILVNNAGAYHHQTWMEATPARWIETYESNVLSGVRMIHRLLPQMRERRWGRVIQIGGGLAIQPVPTTQ